MMKYTQVSDCVDAFILKTFGFKVDEMDNKSLLDPSIGLEPRDLIYLFFELQKQFGIKFIEEDILERKFHMLDDIKNAIYEKLNNESGTYVCQK